MLSCPYYRNCFPNLLHGRFKGNREVALWSEEKFCVKDYTECARFLLLSRMKYDATREIPLLAQLIEPFQRARALRMIGHDKEIGSRIRK